MVDTASHHSAHDTVDRLAGLSAGDETHTIRHQRAKVVTATQGSEDLLFDPALPGLSVIERLLVALLACTLTPAPDMAEHYRQRLLDAKADLVTVNLVEDGSIEVITEPRLRAILTFTHTLITDPIRGDKAALEALPKAGLGTPEIVTLSQLIAFLSYQIRLVAGLKAMKSLEDAA